MSSYLRIDGEEMPFVGARLTWQHAESDGHAGILFHLAAHGGRSILHLASWAPGRAVAELSGQNVRLSGSGCDAALDGRLFAHADLRFGRVTEERAVMSLDGEVESLDPADETRAGVEADIRCSVAQDVERRHCLSCGGPLAEDVTTREEYIGGRRVRMRRTPALCSACTGYVGDPRHCPHCGDRYVGDQVHSFADETTVEYWATCSAGHTTSGTLGASSSA